MPALLNLYINVNSCQLIPIFNFYNIILYVCGVFAIQMQKCKKNQPEDWFYTLL